MPIYEYKCPSCRKLFEEWVKTHDTSPQPCPDCGALAPHIVSNTTFVLKGGGWYVTEYGNRKGEGGSSVADSGAPDSAPSGSVSPGDSESGTVASSETAPAETKSESAASAPPVAPAAKGTAVSAA